MQRQRPLLFVLLGYLPNFTQANALQRHFSSPSETPDCEYASTVTSYTPISTITTELEPTSFEYEFTVTSYSPTTTIPTTITTERATLDKSCTFTGTQTWYSTSGCDLTCSKGFCIMDAAVTRSCGCPSIEITTTTITICPTRTPCYQCTTGWGTFSVYLPCPTSVAPPPSVVTK